MTKSARQRHGVQPLGSEQQQLRDAQANLLDLIAERGIQTTLLHSTSKKNWKLSPALKEIGLKLFTKHTKELPLGSL